MQSIGQDIIAYWKVNGLPIQPGASPSDIHYFEAKHQVRLPDDLREYFTQVDGMSDFFPGDSDANGYSFYALKHMRSVAEEAKRHQGELHIWLSFPEANSYFIFADYLHWSWKIAIRLSVDNQASTPVFLIGKREVPVQIAGSFTEFIALYLIDSQELYATDKED